MRFPWGFNPPKESFETRTLIGRMWKCSNALSWPVLIAREAWSYNLSSWMLVMSVKIKVWLVLKLINNHKIPFNLDLRLKNLYFFQFVTEACVWRSNTKTQSTTLPVMLGGHSGLDPPLPISNRAVKRTSANDSMLFACESRSPPSYLYLLTIISLITI